MTTNKIETQDEIQMEINNGEYQSLPKGFKFQRITNCR